MITDVPGVRLGHWTDAKAQTGCTVVLLPSGTVGSGEVRGGAPGTREWALLDPGRTVDRVDAVVLTGGSAFGLAACDGVVRWCEERGIGYPTQAGPVPIVVGMVIYDLLVGDPSVRPSAQDGYAACVASESPGASHRGRIGAGAGATVAKWKGDGSSRPGAIGSASAREDDLIVSALMVVNSVGDLRVAGEERPRVPVSPLGVVEATTIGVIVTNAALDKSGCLKVAESGHDGLGRALDPAHTAADGDAIVAAATGPAIAPLEAVRALGAWVVERAIEDALSAS